MLQTIRWTLVTRRDLANGSWSLVLHPSTVHSTVLQLLMHLKRSLRGLASVSSQHHSS
jgi:hypothetical protein